MKPTMPTVVNDANRCSGGKLTAFSPAVSAIGDAASADCELEPDVLIDLRGSSVDAAPAHEADREAVLASADLGIHTAGRGQQHAHEARLVVTVERVLVQPARRDLRRRLGASRV